MNKIKKIIKKFFKGLFIFTIGLIGIIIIMRFIFDIPALPYSLKLPYELKNHKILLVKGYPKTHFKHFKPQAIYFKTYVSSKMQEKLIYNLLKNEQILDGKIMNKKIILFIAKPDDYIYIYSYENNKIKEITKFKKSYKKISIINNNTVGLIYYDKINFIDINNNQKNNKEIKLNILDQLDLDLYDKENLLYKNTFFYDKNDNSVKIVGEFDGTKYKIISCELSQDNNCKVEKYKLKDPEIPFFLLKDKNKLNYIRANYNDYKFCINFLVFNTTCNSYHIQSIYLADSDNKKIKTLNKITDLKIFEISMFNVFSKDINYFKLSSDKQHVLYRVALDTYILDIKSNRKKLIEKNSYSLDIE